MKKYLIGLILLLSSVIGYSQTYLGETSILPGTSTATTRLAFPFVAPATGTLDEVYFYYNITGLTSREVLVGVYDNSSTFTPSTLLGVTDIITLTAGTSGWKSASLLSPTTTITTNDTIWLAIVSDKSLFLATSTVNGSAGINKRTATSNNLFINGMPNPFGPSGSSTGTASIYAHYTVTVASYSPVSGRDVWPKVDGNNQIPAYRGNPLYFKKKTLPPPVLTALDPLNIGINATIGVEDYDGVCPSGKSRLEDTDCAINDFQYATTRKFKSYLDYTNVVYIDPGYVGTETGTISQPYNSFTDVTITTNTAYLLKRGTTLTHSEEIEILVNNVLIGAYGSGDRPQLKTTQDMNTFYITGDNCTVRDIYPQNHFSPHNITNAHSPFQCSNAVNLDIFNNEIAYGHMGVRTGGGSTGMRIVNNYIHDMYVDGAYIQNQNYTEFAWNIVNNINKAYFDNTDMAYSSGDGIQFAGASSTWKEAWVHHNNIDRSDEANKANIMFTTSNAGNDKIILEYNKLKAPNTDASGAQSINASGAFTKIIANNEFTTGDWNTYGLYGGTTGDSVIGNLFVGHRVAYQGGNGVVVAHNTFYDNDTSIYRSSGSIGKYYNNLHYNNRNELVGIGVTDSLNNYNQDPSFESVSNSDFRLKSTSKMISKGSHLDYAKYDIYGTFRPTGAARDIGAYEYTSAIKGLSEYNIFFAEDMNSFATGAMPRDTLFKYWQPYYGNFGKANQRIVDLGGEHGKVFRTQYLANQCGSGPGLELALMLDTTLREIYIEVQTWFANDFWDDPSDGHSSGKTTFGGALGGWWAKNTSLGLDFAVDTSNSHQTNGWGVHSVWGTPNGSTSLYPNRVMVYYHDQLSNQNTMPMAGCYINRGEWATYTTRIKLNSYGVKNGIIERYKNGVLVAQQTDVYFQSMAQFTGGYNNIEGIILKFAVGGSNSYCTDRLLVEYFDNVVAYNYNPTSQYYIQGAAPSGHTIPIVAGTVANRYTDPVVYNRTYTAQSGTISGNVTGATYAPAEKSATIEITGHTGNINMSFLGWFDGYNSPDYPNMWVKIYSGTGVGKNLLYTFDEASLNGAPTIGATLPIGATSATIEYYTGRDLSIDWLLRYW